MSFVFLIYYLNLWPPSFILAPARYTLVKRFDLSLINKEDVDSVRNSVQTLLDTYGKAIQDLQKASNLKEDETAALKEYEKSYASLEKIQGNPEKGKAFSIGQLQKYLDVTIDADEW